MKKLNRGAKTLSTFLEAIESDKFSKKEPNNTKKLVDFMTKGRTSCGDSEDVANQVAMRKAELKKGKPNNPRIDEAGPYDNSPSREAELERMEMEGGKRHSPCNVGRGNVGRGNVEPDGKEWDEPEDDYEEGEIDYGL
jgi:hypothetical protein